MANFRFTAPFSMRTTDLFFGSLEDVNPGRTVGLPDVVNFFSVQTEGESRVDFSGEFFSNAVGTRDGDIRAFRAGEIIEDDEGNDTNLIAVTISAVGLDTDRSQFDNAFFGGSSLAIFSLFGSDSDRMIGSFGNDELFGFRGDDTMLGGAGNDILKGGGGDDVVKGAVGADNVNGGSGDDVLRGNGGFDTIIGGTGNDMLFGGGGRDNLRAGSGDDTMNGNGGADTIDAGSGDDIVDGANGSDLIDAGSGDDIIRGGNGADTLEGGAGDDRLTGGARVDTFVFASDGGDDVVTDYEDNLDKIQIEGNVAFVDIDIDQEGADAVISFGAATITLLGQDATELTETDFLF